MDRLDKWDRRFVDLALIFSTWSKDPSTKCGCVITDGKFVKSTGYNGYPVGVEDVEDSRENKLGKTIHAEVNAILGIPSEFIKKYSLTLYVMPLPPCSNCASIICQTQKIGKVISFTPPEYVEAYERWEESLELGRNMLTQCGIESVYHVRR
jgi:dCMP deaminase